METSGIITQDDLERTIKVLQKPTTPIYCEECGAYIGEAVPGYLRSAMCFCGAVVSIPVPTVDAMAEDNTAVAAA